MAVVIFALSTLFSEAAILARESFEYAAQPLNGLNGGTGWDGGWEVQHVSNTTYRVDTNDVFRPAVNGLDAPGNYAVGGGDFLTSGRMLDVAGAFSAYRAGDDIGATNSSLWMSFMMRRLNGTCPSQFTLNSGGIVWSMADAKVDVQANLVGGIRFWGLNVAGSATPSNSTVRAGAGETAFMVLNVRFGEPGVTAHQVKLYVNPPVGCGDRLGRRVHRHNSQLLRNELPAERHELLDAERP